MFSQLHKNANATAVLTYVVTMHRDLDAIAEIARSWRWRKGQLVLHVNSHLRVNSSKLPLRYMIYSSAIVMR